MKYSLGLKFLAIVLCAVTLVGAVGTGLGGILLVSQDLINRDVAAEQEAEEQDILRRVADELVWEYASVNRGGCASPLVENYYGSGWADGYLRGNCWYYSIQNAGGTVLEQTEPYYSDRHSYSEYSFRVDTTYLKVISGPEAATENQYPWGYGGTTIAPGETLGTYSIVYWDYDWDRYVVCTVREAELENMTVTLWLTDDAFEQESEWAILALLARLGYGIFLYFLAFLLVFAAGAVYLCYAAGRNPRDERIHPGGLNLIPLDLYAAAMIFGGVLVVLLLDSFYYMDYHAGLLVLMTLACLGEALVLVGFCFAAAAQFKTPGGYWWRHSILGWMLIKIGHGLRRCARGIARLIRMIPLIWQWLLTAAVMAFVYGFAIHALRYSGDGAFLLLPVILACIGVVCYGAYAYGLLAEGAKKMAEGDLHHKISTRYLVGSFREAAERLNHLGDVAVDAAKQQMKSERMKTELITNVSHDIKTPLTSIINFVDLLQKPHTETEGAEYLEVLSRQSQRLKRLIEDLMELSKADTGNIHVSVTEMDAVEVVQQALGEFSDKLGSAGLLPVLRVPAGPIPMLADGRLAWRVLSNLLTNTVKYALPGTRVYVDVTELGEQVLISVKNISAEQLNTEAEELMERFVRGDASRNIEGSGLGLNIARSLMEVQNGQLQLLVDGDLFKVSLIFPKK